MSKFLALIVAVAMALFLAGQAVAQEDQAFTVTATEETTIDVTKTYNKDFSDTVTREEDITIDKDFTVDASADASIDVDADVIFKELDLQLLEDESVIKFFELDDFAKSVWHIEGLHGVDILEQFQVGDDNFAVSDQLASPLGVPGSENIMNVGLQYQIGNANFADTIQLPGGFISGVLVVDTNNFAKQWQIGDGNGAIIRQNSP